MVDFSLNLVMLEGTTGPTVHNQEHLKFLFL